MSTPIARPLADFLWLFVGPGVWFAHFTFLYGAETLLCLPPAASPHAVLWLAAIATALALGTLGAFATMMWRRARTGGREPPAGVGFLRNATLLLTLLSALAVTWTALPVAMLRACTGWGG
jgi:hypothetical protein